MYFCRLSLVLSNMYKYLKEYIIPSISARPTSIRSIIPISTNLLAVVSLTFRIVAIS